VVPLLLDKLPILVHRLKNREYSLKGDLNFLGEFFGRKVFITGSARESCHERERLKRWQWSANLASSAISSIRCRSHRAGARRLGVAPENCHLLLLLFVAARPSDSLQSVPSIAPLEGGAASLGPGLRTVSGAVIVSL
jgi:hypothetical protein